MDAIIFYNGEEKEYIIEKNNLTSSIFKEQYERALRLIQDIVNNPNNTTLSYSIFLWRQGRRQNILHAHHNVFIGRRK